MSISKKSFGQLRNGTGVSLYTISNSKGMEASVTDFGAILVSLVVPDKDGNAEDVVLGFDNVDGYTSNSNFFGATVGRNANRIGGACFEIDGVRYPVAVNENTNNLHSDKDTGFHKRIWDTDIIDDDTVRFSLISKDGDMGFPGTLNISVSYTLTEDNGIEISYLGTCNKKTVVNMTNHSYFNLSGHDKGNIEDTVLQLNAGNYTPIVFGAIPTGEIATVKGTPLDFTSPKSIGRDIEEDFCQLTMVQGYDHNFVIDDYDGSMKKVAVASASGRIMEVYTDLPGVQFYAGNCIARETGKGGAIYDKRSGFCLETQYFPDSMNRKNFVSPVLEANKEYKTKTIYKFC